MYRGIRENQRADNLVKEAAKREEIKKLNHQSQREKSTKYQMEHQRDNKVKKGFDPQQSGAGEEQNRMNK